MDKEISVYDLSSDQGLKKACSDLETEYGQSADFIKWRHDLIEFLSRVENANSEERASLSFQTDLWEHNPVSGVGMGTVKVDKAIVDEGFRQWLAAESLKPVPDTHEKRVVYFRQLNMELFERLTPFCDRKPRLKVLRVLAAFYPDYFTTIAHSPKAKRLAVQMFGKGLQPIDRQVAIRQRLDEVLGSVGNDWASRVNRLTLPWLLFAEAVPTDEDEVTVIPAVTPGADKLIPLPAARRRRGMTSMKGGFNAVLGVLEFAREGVTREELRDYLKAQNPALKESSLNTAIYVLRAELGVIRREGDSYVPSDRGEAILESGEANELADWILTKILGVDIALVQLRDKGPTNHGKLLKIIQAANPGWTTTFAPGSIIQWLYSFGVIEAGQNGLIQLTSDGQEWAKQIHWQPEVLPRDEGKDQGINAGIGSEDQTGTQELQLPTVEEVCSAVMKKGAFVNTLVAKLHAGIWSNRRRHFAVLTGLSGSGKTLLARAYANALYPEDEAKQKDHLHIVSVQPGWYDPGPLLGYVNPLRSEAYVRTPFLDFLLQAVSNPQEPFVVVLDEMNLSRPEQYLAPLLSAMETGAPIDLHREDDVLDGIPSSIPYPTNLVLIGTVNMDETTHGLSDKVLDRAFTLEFWDIDLTTYPSWGSRKLLPANETKVRDVLTELMTALRPARLHFGWRVVDEVLDYLTMIGESNPLSFEDALDGVIYAKVLPKLRGDDNPRFRQALSQCSDVLNKHSLGQSLMKVKELEIDLEHTGSARFWR